MNINKQIFMRYSNFMACALLAGSASAFATANDPQADSFTNIFASICMKHLPDLDALRDKLRGLPKLPPEKAAAFLSGLPGSAWPVPDKHGTFVVVIPDNKNQCSVYARRLNAPAAESRFTRLVAQAPNPLVSRVMEEPRTTSPKNGPTHTISYEWSVANAPKKMLFMLTTATSETADIQGIATAALGR